MKATSLLIACLAVAALSATAKAENKPLASTTGNCSTTTDSFSPVQCTKPLAHSYVECTEMIAKSGARPNDAWWWCTNQKFKN
jgi:hypothetical protein